MGACMASPQYCKIRNEESVPAKFTARVPLIDWISDTRSQGCTDLQSLVKCLDHRVIVLAFHSTCC